jgi:hypothetical protein
VKRGLLIYVSNTGNRSWNVIALAFLLDGSVPKGTDGGAKKKFRTVLNLEGFRQSMFQGFALGIESLLGRWRGSQRFQPRKEPSGGFAEPSKRATCFALMLRVRPAGLESLLE